MTEQTAFSMPIKLVAIDIDGTLLNSNHELTPRTEQAVKSAVQQGIHVVLTTGKTRTSAEPFLSRLGLTSPSIFCGGAITYSGDGRILEHLTLDPQVVRQALTFAEDRGYDVVIYSANRLLTRRDNPMARLIVEYGEPQSEIVGPLQNFLDTVPVTKVLFYNDTPSRLKSLRWQLNVQLGGAVKMVQSAVDTQLEMLPPTASKGMALRRLLKTLDITTAQVMAIGDAENDIDMLESVAVGVAMGNAAEKLKAVAKHVVASNDADGVAEAFERFVLTPSAKPETASSSSTDSTAARTLEDAGAAQPKPEDTLPSAGDA